MKLYKLFDFNEEEQNLIQFLFPPIGEEEQNLAQFLFAPTGGLEYRHVMYKVSIIPLILNPIIRVYGSL